MIYYNYDRDDQIHAGNYEKRFNRHGSEVDSDAKAFIRNANNYIHKQYPDVLVMAEESSGFSNLNYSPEQRGEHSKMRGFGFDLTWHMGFMNDTLKFWNMHADQRRDAYPLFTSTIKNVDAGSDSRPRGKVVLAYSHDESANAKGTILARMAGGDDRAQKYANGRLALAYQLLRGGGPTLDMMGNDTLQTMEWHFIVRMNQTFDIWDAETRNNWQNGKWRDALPSSTSPEEFGAWENTLKYMQEHPEYQTPNPSFQWVGLDPNVDKDEHHFHRGAQASRRDLNHLLLNNPGLWDQTDHGFSWIKAEDSTNCIASFHRRSQDERQQFACIFNASANDISDYYIPLPDADFAPELDRLTGVTEVYNTDAINYGGQGRRNGSVEIIRDQYSRRPTHFKLRLPPFTAIVLEEFFS
jgi:1,4-alpha-glucan branching enzyme